MPTPRIGRDLLVTPFYQGDTWRSVDLTPEPHVHGETRKLAATDGADTLRQALVLRLLTPVGSLAALGHSAYGSRLHELVGEPYSERLRHLARAMVLEAVAAERRAELLALDVAPPTAEAPDTLRISLRVAPVDGGEPLTMGVEVTL